MAEIGDRIGSLLDESGMGAKQLAEEVGLDESAISRIRSNERAVKSRELSAIAKALGVSPVALLEDDTFLSRLAVAPRSNDMDTDLRLGDAYAKMMQLAELSNVLSEGGIPSAPSYEQMQADPVNAWRNTASTMAAQAGAQLGVKDTERNRFEALADAIETQFGIDVWVDSFRDEPLAGAAITDREFPLIFVNSDSQAPRALFTLAHELGHVLAGHGTDNAGVRLDGRLFSNGADERLANTFAADLLMPEERVKEIVDKYGRNTKALGVLLDTFEVSFSATVYRLHNLRIISAAGRDKLLAVGWGNLVNELRQDPSNSSMVNRIVQQASAQPAERAPSLLTLRAMDGARQGVVSVRPLAGLTGQSEEDLLAQLSISSEVVRGVLEGEPFEAPDDVDDDELFDTFVA